MTPTASAFSSIRLITRHSTFKLLSLIAIATSLATGCSSEPKSATDDACLKRRGAIDVGSGSTKAFAAVVDVCQTPHKITEQILDEKTKISFAESIEKSPEGKIAEDVATDAAVKISNIASAMKKKNVLDITIVATAAFRKAKNGSDIAKTISNAASRATNLPLQVQIITQEQEAEAGARSALLRAPKKADGQPVVVWDIGGGSMQMWSAPSAMENTPPAAPILFTGDLASVTFKNRVIRDIQKKDPNVVKSPNPLVARKKTKADGAAVKKAIAISKDHADKNVPVYFKDIGHRAQWIGIGGVLAISLQKQIEKKVDGKALKSFTEKELAKTLGARAVLTDEEIESDFKETDITNLALVLGYMQALKIPRVDLVEASLVQGLVAR